MAMYHFCAKYVSRNQGRSAVAAAAYRSGQRLHNEYDGLTYDFTHKGGIVHTEILLPPNAPSKFYDREMLWNSVERSEKRSNARTAREVEVALPNELRLEEQIRLVREYVTDQFISLGMCADVAFHDGDSSPRKNTHRIKNPHAHILLTTRPIGPDGFDKKKNRDWNMREYILLWREQWAKAQNKELERKGFRIRLSHESYAAQGIDREPTKHLGPNVKALEQRGICTDRGNENRAIIARNRERDERARQREKQCQREHERELER